MGDDFITRYFSYTDKTEPPKLFHRWAALVGIGAYLGRRFYMRQGHFKIHPNMYCMLVGVSGSRKSTAIKLMKKLLVSTGYDTFAADKTTKEKFLLDLAGEDGSGEVIDPAYANIFGADFEAYDREILIAADEFNDFIGIGNLEFISTLGSLWDYEGIYKSRIKTGKSVAINNPTVSILGGNTPTNLSVAFPSATVGQGFFSRMLLVYSDPSGKKITRPEVPDPAETQELIEYLGEIKTKCVGESVVTSGADLLLDKIYKTHIPLEDVRFESYSGRRFDHLLKLCLVVAASRLSTEITEQDVIYANTILTHTEHFMPKALGEFGKARHSDTVHKIMQLLDSTHKVLSMADIWKAVVQDLEKISDLADILRNLVLAEKIQSVKGGFLPYKKRQIEVSDDILNFGLLLPEELGKLAGPEKLRLVEVNTGKEMVL